jgi:uncharacterized protein YukE
MSQRLQLLDAWSKRLLALGTLALYAVACIYFFLAMTARSGTAPWAFCSSLILAPFIIFGAFVLMTRSRRELAKEYERSRRALSRFWWGRSSAQHPDDWDGWNEQNMEMPFGRSYQEYSVLRQRARNAAAAAMAARDATTPPPSLQTAAIPPLGAPASLSLARNSEPAGPHQEPHHHDNVDDQDDTDDDGVFVDAPAEPAAGRGALQTPLPPPLLPPASATQSSPAPSASTRRHAPRTARQPHSSRHSVLSGAASHTTGAQAPRGLDLLLGSPSPDP